MSVTQREKYRNFVSAPMGQKLVTELAGIEGEVGQRLVDLGFNKANKVLAQYLSLDQDQKRFEKWLQNTATASKAQSVECHRCLADWCQEFL